MKKDSKLHQPELHETTSTSPYQTETEPTEYRCDCGKLLFKGFFLAGQIEIKCRRCGGVQVFHTTDEHSEL